MSVRRGVPGPLRRERSKRGRDPQLRELREPYPLGDVKVPHPDAYRFAAYLGRLWGCDTLIDVRGGTPDRLAALRRWFEIVVVGHAHDPQDGLSAALPDLPGVIERSVVVCAFDGVVDPPAMIADLERWMRRAPVAVVTASHGSGTDSAPGWTCDDFRRLLEAGGLNVAFVGLTAASDVDPRKTRIVAVVENTSQERTSPPPDGFRVAAIVATYNEEDVIETTLRRMIDGGLDVHVIDNWSTDSTFERVEAFAGDGVVHVERLPADGPSPVGDLRAILARKEEIARRSGADWVIHHDADEIRVSPWPGVPLRDAIYRVDRAGFTAVDHTVVEFPPLDDGYVSGSAYDAYFQHFAFAKSRRLQIKAWKNQATPVGLAERGGHVVSFEGMRVFPYNFLLKHYPIRSQRHGERKVFTERRDRYAREFETLGWHGHYSRVQPGHAFERAAEDLELYDEERFNRDYVVERLAGIGVSR